MDKAFYIYCLIWASQHFKLRIVILIQQLRKQSSEKLRMKNLPIGKIAEMEFQPRFAWMLNLDSSQAPPWSTESTLPSANTQCCTKRIPWKQNNKEVWSQEFYPFGLISESHWILCIDIPEIGPILLLMVEYKSVLWATLDKDASSLFFKSTPLPGNFL